MNQISKGSIVKRAQLLVKLLPRILKYYKIQRIIFRYFEGHMLFTFTKLGLPDHLNEAPKTSAELASELKLQERSLDLLLQCQVKLGMLKKDSRGAYSLTKLGQVLVSDTSDSLDGTIKSMADLVGTSWQDMNYCIETGQAAFDKSFEMGFYEYMNINPTANTMFTNWMSETIREWVIPALDFLDFSKAQKVVDVGGNAGELISRILLKYPNIQGTVYDRVYAEDKAHEVFKTFKVEDRASFISGDFFSHVPKGGDIYTMSRVLDNWDDEPALKILQNTRAAMDKSARLVIIDSVFPNKNPNRIDLLVNLHVLAMGKGVVRTEQEYADLLAKAGFKATQLLKTGGPTCFIEAVPV